MNIKEIKSLSEMLKYNTSLKKLTFIINETLFNDLCLIYKSLEFNKNLEELTLLDNKNVNADINQRFDLYPLCKTLYFNKTIKKLTLSSHGFKDINMIFDILKNNHHIKDLFLHIDIPYTIYNSAFINNILIKINKTLNFNRKLYNDF